MKCKTCGSELLAGTKECPVCGTAVEIARDNGSEGFEWSVQDFPKPKKKADLSIDWSAGKIVDNDSGKVYYQSASKWAEPDEVKNLFTFDEKNEEYQEMLDKQMESISYDQPAGALGADAPTFRLPQAMDMGEFDYLINDDTSIDLVSADGDKISIDADGEAHKVPKDAVEEKKQDAGAKAGDHSSDASRGIFDGVGASDADHTDVNASGAGHAGHSGFDFGGAGDKSHDDSGNNGAKESGAGHSSFDFGGADAGNAGHDSHDIFGNVDAGSASHGNHDSANAGSASHGGHDSFGNSGASSASHGDHDSANAGSASHHGHDAADTAHTQAAYTQDDEDRVYSGLKKLMDAEEKFKTDMERISYLNPEESDRAEAVVHKSSKLSLVPDISFRTLEDEYEAYKSENGIPTATAGDSDASEGGKEVQIKINEPSGTRVTVKTQEIDLARINEAQKTREVELRELRKGPKNVQVSVEVNGAKGNASVEVTRRHDGATVVKTSENGSESEHLFVNADPDDVTSGEAAQGKQAPSDEPALKDQFTPEESKRFWEKPESTSRMTITDIFGPEARKILGQTSSDEDDELDLDDEELRESLILDIDPDDIALTKDQAMAIKTPTKDTDSVRAFELETEAASESEEAVENASEPAEAAETAETTDFVYNEAEENAEAIAATDAAETTTTADAADLTNLEAAKVAADEDADRADATADEEDGAGSSEAVTDALVETNSDENDVAEKAADTDGGEGAAAEASVSDAWDKDADAQDEKVMAAASGAASAVRTVVAAPSETLEGESDDAESRLVNEAHRKETDGTPGVAPETEASGIADRMPLGASAACTSREADDVSGDTIRIPAAGSQGAASRATERRTFISNEIDSDMPISIIDDIDEDEDEEEGKYSGVIKALIVILAVVLAVEFTVIGVKLFAPDSGAAVFIERVEDQALGLVDKVTS